MILVTTSDYYPKLGGLSTFTMNIEKVLTELGLSYELFHWKKYQDIQNNSSLDLSRFSLILNIHPQFAWLSESHHGKMINFVHGSEILMTSPNFVKKLFKRINSRKYFSKIESSYLNIFISEATHSKAIQSGFKTDYSRDLVFHNCIETKDAQYVQKQLKNRLVFSCIVRNVPHKNITGSLKFCELVAEHTGKEVDLIVPKNSNLVSTKVRVIEIGSFENAERDDAYKKAHYNLLLSGDYSHQGYYEGFGLTVLEAAKFGTPSIVMNTGGLSESVHHGETGWVIDDVSEKSVRTIFSTENNSAYQKMSVDCYAHTIRSHSLSEYSKLITMVLSSFNTGRGAA